MKWHSYIQSASQILNTYEGEVPFHHFIRQFFRQDKKYGSRDRRAISQLCYGFLRMGKALADHAMDERMLAGYFLIAPHRDDMLLALRPEWYNWWAGHPAATLREKINHLKQNTPTLREGDIFPFSGWLGAVSDPAAFTRSHLVQPDVYLRFRPGHKKTVLMKLEKAGVPYQLIAPATAAVPANAAVDQIIELNREAVIQDASSQMAGDFIEEVKHLLPEKNPSVWDCCAASGGKSIMVKDVLGKINLTVSDIRESILHNLKSRFKEAGIGSYHSFVADLSNEKKFLPIQPEQFDMIVADVPCSGSGTWARTPEQLVFFEENKLEYYTSLQKKITERVLPYLRKNGVFLYITCSVFKRENETMVDFLLSEKNLTLIKSGYLQGYTRKADTLFAAVFTA